MRGSMSNDATPPDGSVTVCASRSMVASAGAAARSSAIAASSSTAQSRPTLAQFERKMSANDGARIAR